MDSEQGEQQTEGRWNQLYFYDQLAEGLYDILVDTEDRGLTIEEIAAALDIPVHVARKTIRHMRKVFAEDHDINLIYRNDGRNRRYVLTRDMNVASPRFESRLRMFASNFETELMLLSSLAAAYDRTTEEGQDVHSLVKMMGRLQEDVEEMLDRRKAERRATTPKPAERPEGKAALFA